ncbi:NYN domain-containing protein [Candidatus Pacearchaeota archaeon]|nr:NYN domain-containing protein [Candidatus Pacearchaeota archaeon]
MDDIRKIYKDEYSGNISMLPGDLKGSPDESFYSKLSDTLVFIDDGFLAKLSKYLGGERYLRFDKIVFAKNIARKQNLQCKQIFYYTAPPFQNDPPTKEEEVRKEGYDKFIGSLQKNHEVTIREGRVQRLKINNEFIYKQKAVDSLAIIDLMKVPLKYPLIKKIILVSSDSDFVPAVESLKEFGVKTILYTYYKKKRNTNFSRSNELIKSVYKYVLLTKEDFDNAPLDKNKENK